MKVYEGCKAMTRECNGRGYYKRERERKEKRDPGNYYEVLPREIT